jgi:UDP-N-acetylmuramoyl-L-alanyl-D-glutamate--2,6-diaminopimelate ligase
VSGVLLHALVAKIPSAELLVAEGFSCGSASEIHVTDVVHDSRSVSPGALFCCVTGVRHDGHDHAAEAIERGAVAILVERSLDIDAPQIRVPDTRAAMAPAAAACFGNPSDSITVVGITGTNGKTTTTWLLRAILEHAGRPTEVLGTLSGARTTPESPDIQRQLAQWRDGGINVVAMEVSSHALSLHRVDCTKFALAVFTNLSRDHLDFHDSMESYFGAKARLFEPDLAERAIVNLDSPYGRLLADTVSIPVDGFTLDEVGDIRLEASGSTFLWRGNWVTLAIGGEFNVSNALAAAHVASALGIADDVIAAGLSVPIVVPGRFELVDRGQQFAVVVDFAHTPDGLAQLLGAADGLVSMDASGTRGRVVVVFGCGGDRDVTKRPAMGESAADLADIVIVTADNSRSESTNAIIESIMTGVERSSLRRAKEVVVEPDRRAAIARAVSLAGQGDVVIIAGKGHETTQTIGDVTEPFDDRIVAAEELTRIEGRT